MQKLNLFWPPNGCVTDYIAAVYVQRSKVDPERECLYIAKLYQTNFKILTWRRLSHKLKYIVQKIKFLVSFFLKNTYTQHQTKSKWEIGWYSIFFQSSSISNKWMIAGNSCLTFAQVLLLQSLNLLCPHICWQDSIFTCSLFTCCYLQG